MCQAVDLSMHNFAVEDWISVLKSLLIAFPNVQDLNLRRVELSDTDWTILQVLNFIDFDLTRIKTLAVTLDDKYDAKAGGTDLRNLWNCFPNLNSLFVDGWCMFNLEDYMEFRFLEHFQIEFQLPLEGIRRLFLACPLLRSLTLSSPWLHRIEIAASQWSPPRHRRIPNDAKKLKQDANLLSQRIRRGATLLTLAPCCPPNLEVLVVDVQSECLQKFWRRVGEHRLRQR